MKFKIFLKFYLWHALELQCIAPYHEHLTKFPRYRLLSIPNRTSLVWFGSSISGQFGRAMVCILAGRRRAKIPMARPNEPDMPPICKVRLGIYRTQIQPKIQ